MQLLKQVSEGGYCIGCGACSAVKSTPHTIGLNAFGLLQASIGDSEDSNVRIATEFVCPFTGVGPNETEIGEELFGSDCKFDDQIGYHLGVYAGHVIDGSFREKGTSGGGITWLCVELLKRGLIDGVIHVHSREKNEHNAQLFEYAISDSEEAVIGGAKSRYYPIEMSKVLKFVRENQGRYAFVGIPCYVKAVRLLAMQEPIFKERIAFCIGVICGHLKSAKYADLLAWECGVQPGNLGAIDFRVKIENQPASSYGISVRDDTTGLTINPQKPASKFFGNDWGMGFMQYHACDFCDDVLVETADVSFGDAWLPQYNQDSKGTNVVVIRNKDVFTIIEEGIAAGVLNFDKISASMAAESQSGGLRHRRIGLSYRLFLADQKGIWRPPKRIEPNTLKHEPRLRRIHDFRIRLRAQSHLAFQEALLARSFERFVELMEPLVTQYKRSTMPPFQKRLVTTLRRIAKYLLRRK